MIRFFGCVMALVLSVAAIAADEIRQVSATANGRTENLAVWQAKRAAVKKVIPSLLNFKSDLVNEELGAWLELLSNRFVGNNFELVASTTAADMSIEATVNAQVNVTAMRDWIAGRLKLYTLANQIRRPDFINPAHAQSVTGFLTDLFADYAEIYQVNIVPRVISLNPHQEELFDTGLDKFDQPQVIVDYTLSVVPEDYYAYLANFDAALSKFKVRKGAKYSQNDNEYAITYNSKPGSGTSNTWQYWFIDKRLINLVTLRQMVENSYLTIKMECLDQDKNVLAEKTSIIGSRRILVAGKTLAEIQIPCRDQIPPVISNRGYVELRVKSRDDFDKIKSIRVTLSRGALVYNQLESHFSRNVFAAQDKK